MKENFNHITKVKGKLYLPGDKSISHRAVMFSALANGKSVINNCSASEDVESTIKCFRQLGCTISRNSNEILVLGKGFKGFKKPERILDAGNSGTTARLITGILSAQDFSTTIVGDKSLSKRPMRRIIDPLKQMGAEISASTQDTLPLIIKPSDLLEPIVYKLPVPSAQVKSSILFSGLHLEEATKVIENIPSRNHTENMLNLPVAKDNNETIISVSKNNYPVPQNYFIPSDISSAAFFIVLTLLLKDSNIVIKNVSLNESRTGILRVLEFMGAEFEINNVNNSANEFYGDLNIKSKNLVNVEIPETLIPNIIDEIPILSIAGIFAEGEFTIRGAKELRFKETDRIKAMCDNFKKLGLTVEEYEDGYTVSGTIVNKDVLFESFGDHRIAMSFAVLSLLLENGGMVNDFDCVRISNPDFIEQLNSIVV
ncbi:3-phosphoshikimate 1-carboxyvinyltransferase 1 [bacterium BMS3Abin04]|nr:3-phosphoshikimate 1-carboxyvinyltransferase 1 [bacterium BMS3Abin04]